jgi:rubrerythrin
MAGMFEVTELVKVGVEDERTGVAFYQASSAKARSKDLKRIFADLAEQERYHQKRFEQLLRDLGGYKSPERYSGEYASYLEALTTDRAFPDEDTALKKVAGGGDDRSLVEMASRFERDTLGLMNEMRKLVREQDRPVVDQLIREEQGHLVTLSVARDKLV